MKLLQTCDRRVSIPGLVASIKLIPTESLVRRLSNELLTRIQVCFPLKVDGFQKKNVYKDYTKCINMVKLLL